MATRLPLADDDDDSDEGGLNPKSLSLRNARQHVRLH